MLGRSYVDARCMLKRILKKLEMKELAALICLRTGKNGGLL
jgi:hypothetical protein